MTVEDFMEMQRFIANRRAQSKEAKATTGGSSDEAKNGEGTGSGSGGKGGQAAAQKRLPVGMGRAGGGPRSKL